jgi:hypothetical protein
MTGPFTGRPHENLTAMELGSSIQSAVHNLVDLALLTERDWRERVRLQNKSAAVLEAGMIWADLLNKTEPMADSRELLDEFEDTIVRIMDEKGNGRDGGAAVQGFSLVLDYARAGQRNR